MPKPIVWFTHKEHKWVADLNTKPDWTDELKNWNWDNCTISAIKKSDSEIRVIVRSTDIIHSNLTNADQLIRFIYNFDTPEIFAPVEYPYQDEAGLIHPEFTRWVLAFERTDEPDKNKKYCWIWQWTHQNGKQVIFDIYELLQKAKNSTSANNQIIEGFEDELPPVTNSKSKVLPIIYQPAIDTMKNFIRQIHINKVNKNEFEVTIVFNDEELRHHELFDDIYRNLRQQIFGRTKDVESFRIILEKNNPEYFTFKGIYSEDKDITYDTIHGDKPISGNAEKRSVQHYYGNKRHPVVFVNTSNHAMAGHDNNPRLWKWEYITWGNSPVKVGTLDRAEVENELQDFRQKWLRSTSETIN